LPWIAGKPGSGWRSPGAGLVLAGLALPLARYSLPSAALRETAAARCSALMLTVDLAYTGAR